MGVFALAINIVTIIAFYPMLMEMMNQGDLNGLFGGSQPSPAPASPSPGADLFG